jgi:hypothetical protein
MELRTFMEVVRADAVSGTKRETPCNSQEPLEQLPPENWKTGQKVDWSGRDWCKGKGQGDRETR